MSTAKGSLLPADTRYAAAEDYYLDFERRNAARKREALRSPEDDIPVELTIVANTRSKRFYTPRDAQYERAMRQVNVIMFANEHLAIQEGYRPPWMD